MKTKSKWQRSQELQKLAAQLGAELPAYPDAFQIALVADTIMRQAHCQRASAISAIVHGVLRPKRKAAQR